MNAHIKKTYIPQKYRGDLLVVMKLTKVLLKYWKP
jgi:hypothetical protein